MIHHFHDEIQNLKKKLAWGYQAENFWISVKSCNEITVIKSVKILHIIEYLF